MKQVEFDQTMREMKQQKAEAMRPLQVMINDIKEKQAAKRRVVHELSEQLSKLEQERQQISGRLNDIANDWNKRISDFYHENYTESRELETTSDWALIKELNKRGFRGSLANPDRTDEMIMTANMRLNSETHSDDDNTERMEGHFGKEIEKRASEIIRFTDRPLPKHGIILDGVLYEGIGYDDNDPGNICPGCALKDYCDRYVKGEDGYALCDIHSGACYVQYRKVEK